MNSLSSISKSNKALSAKYSRPKQKQKKIDKKSNEDSINAKSTSSYYNVTPEQNIAYLTKNLKGDSYENELVNMFLKENQNINGLIEKKEMNEKDIIETIEKTSNFDGEIYEEKVAQIFANNFDVEALNLYPYFEIVNSKIKHKKVTQISYFKIACEKNNMISYYYFLNNRKNYLIKFSDLIIIMTKSQGIINNVSVLKNNYDSPREFILQKGGQSYNLSFQYREIIPELADYIKDIENLKSEISNSEHIKEENESILNKEKLEVLEDIKKEYEKKYEEKEIIKKLDSKKIDLKIIENKIKYNNLVKANVEDLKDQYSKIKKEIEDLDLLLTKVTIKVEKHEKELDGFFLSTKEIFLENTIGDKLNIPKGKPIILEVKNNSNYQNIIDNIKEKKRIIRLLGLNDDIFFFVGILRDININEEEKNKINKTINNFNFKNTIIIYPENSKFLGISFIKEKANEYRGILSEIFNRLNQLDEIKKDIAELKSKIK